MRIVPIASFCVIRLDHDAFARDLHATVDALVADGLTVQVHALPEGALLECFDVSGRELGRAQAYGIVGAEDGVHSDADDLGADPEDDVELAQSLDEQLSMLCAFREFALRRADTRLAASLAGQMQGLVLAARAVS